jgi:hypothetical protein
MRDRKTKLEEVLALPENEYMDREYRMKIYERKGGKSDIIPYIPNG